MRKLSILLICLMSMMAIAPAMAQDNSPSNNWCFDGGPLEGKCGTGDTAESDWFWMFGFFAAQVSNGSISVNDVPEEYRVGLEGTSASGSTISGIVEVGKIYDGDGNVIASGPSDSFVGYIVECSFTERHTNVIVGWQGLEVPGDRIEVGTPSGAGSANAVIALSNSSFRLRFSDPVDSIDEDGTMNVFRDGLLIGTSELNGLSSCEDETDD